ncbi:MAG: hypothetical protein WCI77_01690 [Candidatus Omnitrophota bacterium]
MDKDAHSRVAVWIYPKDKSCDIGQLGMEFSNELLNYAHYFTSLKANAGIMKALLQRALFSAAPSLVNEMGKQEVESVIDELEQEEKKRIPKKSK